MENWIEVPGSWIWPDPVLTVGAFQGVNQQLEDTPLLCLVLLFLYLSLSS